MKGKLYFLGVILLALLVGLSTAVEAAPGGSPSLDPDPTPEWELTYIGLSDAVHSGEIGTVYGNVLAAEADPDVEAVVIHRQKLCPTTSNGHWANGGYATSLDGSGNLDGGIAIGNTQNCGYDNWSWWIQEDGESYWATKSKVEEHFPAFGGDADSASYNTHGRNSAFYQTSTSAGTAGDAGFISRLEIWYLSYGVSDCTQPDPADLPVMAEDTIQGDDEDGHHYQLPQSGLDYYIEFSGGPWNDGTSDRYDVALSFDGGETWGIIDSFDAVEEACNAEITDHQRAIVITADEEHSTLDMRVNDQDGEFADNSGSIDYTISVDESGLGTCLDYYTVGDPMDSGTTPADQEHGTGEILGPMYGYNSYLIEILDPWEDGGTSYLDTEVETAYDGNWTRTQYIGENTCVMDQDNTRAIFFNGPYNWGLDEGMFSAGEIKNIRADDKDSSWTNNTGDFSWQLSGASYTSPPSTCAASFDKGTLMETPVLHSSASDGVELPYLSNGFTPGQVYVFEHVDSPTAYYTINGVPRRTFEISPDGDTWYEMEVFADCVNNLDQVRKEYYFTAEQSHYYFRTSQGIPFIDEVSGSLPLNLYGASDKRTGPGESCSDNYSTNEKVFSSSVDSTLTAGESIPRFVFSEGQIYSIQITDPAYTRTGISRYDADIRRAYWGVTGGVDYQPMETWDGALCYEEDEHGKPRLYFEAQPGQYEVRAAGPHVDNSGSLSYEVFTGARDTPINSGCELRDYGDVDYWYPSVQVEVGANDNNPNDPGELIANDLTSSSRYKVEISGGPAYQGHSDYGPVNPTYDLEISTDNGANWQPLVDYLDCVVEVGDYIRGYFSPAEGEGPFRVRVYDPANSYIDNSGSLIFDLWSETDEDPSGPYTSPESPNSPSYGSGCYSTCTPPGFLQVGKMIEYVRCRFTKFISWCPYHTDAIASMKDQFYQVEPFGTIMEVMDTASAVRKEVNAYQWTGEGGGGESTAAVQAPRYFVFAPGEGGGGDIPLVGEETIWGSGEIDLTPESVSFSTECNNLMADSLGARLSQPLCFTFNVVDQLGLKTWFQFIWDIAMLAGLLLYIGNKWVDLMQ